MHRPRTWLWTESIRLERRSAGLIAGAIVGAAEWFALRRWVLWLWIPATSVRMAVGLAAGADIVDYGISRVDLALMGAVTGVGVGVMQALVLARHRIPRALWWAVANPPAWALGWFVSSFESGPSAQLSSATLSAPDIGAARKFRTGYAARSGCGPRCSLRPSSSRHLPPHQRFPGLIRSSPGCSCCCCSRKA